MLVEIRADIFASNYFKELNTLIQTLTYKGRYDLFVDIQQTSTSNLYKRLDSEDQEILQLSFNKYIQEGLSSDILVSETDTEHLNLDEAIRYLSQPVSIVLENSQNDSYFLKAMFRHLDEKGVAQKHLDEGWLQFENAGGAGNIKNFIEGKMQSFDSLPKAKHHYLRAFVLIDSDRKHKDDGISRDKQNVVAFLNKNQIPNHCLAKREMENYLPDEAFEEILDNRNFVDAYLRLTPEQKDYFDIEKGLPNKRFKQLDENVQTLYDSLSNSDKELFRTQDLKKINSSARENFKSDFPKLFLSEKVNKDNLLMRCEHHANDSLELPNLLSSILKLL